VRAAVLHGIEDLRLEDLPEPSPGPADVKVKVTSCGICGSDLHLYRGVGLRNAAGQQPLVLGHEFAGHVVEVGDRVGDVAVGDAVAVRPTVSCGSCGACLAGAVNVCRALRFYGVTPPLAGGMSEYVVVPEANAHRLPPGLDVDRAALAEPLAVGHHAVRRGGASPGDTVVVYGAGPIGISIFLGLAADGVTDVHLVEPSPVRREAAVSLGVGVNAWDPGSTDVRAELLRSTDGRGVHVAFESSGHPAAFTDTQRVTARQGRIVIVAAYEEPVAFDPYFLLSTEQSLTAALAYTPEEFDEVLGRMAAGAYPLDGWVQSIGLEDVLRGGIEAVEQQRATKVLVRP